MYIYVIYIYIYTLYILDSKGKDKTISIIHYSEFHVG